MARVAFAVGCLLLMVRCGAPTLLRRRHGARVPGLVVGIEWRTSIDSGQRSGYPVLRFRTLEGLDVETVSDLGASPCPLQEGQHVTVVYEPTQPQKAAAEDMLSRTSRLFVLGVVFLVAAIVAVTLLG